MWETCELLWSEGKLQQTAQRAIKAAFTADNFSFCNTILQLSLLKSELPRKRGGEEESRILVETRPGQAEVPSGDSLV